MLAILFGLWSLLIISNFLVITIYTKKYKKAPYMYQIIAYSTMGSIAILSAIFLKSGIAIGCVLASAVVSFFAAIYSVFSKKEYENTMKELKEVEELYNKMMLNK